MLNKGLCRVLPLQIQKKALANSIKDIKAEKGVYDISEKDVKEVLSNLEYEVKHADPKIRKRAFQTLFEEIRIFPKEGSPWKRLLEINGVHVPLTRLSVASPRGFEPLLPARKAGDRVSETFPNYLNLL
jgi:hypothetical protein